MNLRMLCKPLAVAGFTCLAIGFAAVSFAAEKKPNILVIWGDDIGIENISYNNRGMMGYHDAQH